MVKKISKALISFVILLLSYSPLHAASLVTINDKGVVSVKVLGDETSSVIDVQKPSSLDVNKVADSSVSDHSVIQLSRDLDKVNLKISSKEGDKSLDVTNWSEDVIEIEERPETQKVRILLEDGKFILRQKGVSVRTDKSITIDSRLAELSVKTDSGNKFLTVLPYEAVQTLLKTKVVNEVSQHNLEITEDGENLAYKIEGNKVINFFDLYLYRIPVSSYISALSGEILKVDSPTIYKYVTFLFV